MRYNHGQSTLTKFRFLENTFASKGNGILKFVTPSGGKESISDLVVNVATKRVSFPKFLVVKIVN